MACFIAHLIAVMKTFGIRYSFCHFPLGNLVTRLENYVVVVVVVVSACDFGAVAIVVLLSLLLLNSGSGVLGCTIICSKLAITNIFP